MEKNAPNSPPHGTLFLVPTPLDFGCDMQAPIADVLPLETMRIAAKTTHWITENAKSTRAFLKRVDVHCPLAKPIQEMIITELPREVHKKGDHIAGFDAKPLLSATFSGHDVALVSEAGMPAVADPGSSVVKTAHEMGVHIVPLVGPMCLPLALASSGLNGQNFAFVGYVPQDNALKLQRIKELETIALKLGQTQLMIETPYRNQALWDSLIQGLQGNTRLARVSGLTLSRMEAHCRTIQEWRTLGKEKISGDPTVFLIGK